ncbi:biotin-dependent enzyme [Actinocorallia herbida]|uniref:Biotin-dependent enzyme n=1 Tax=Actinocorallia herbida TaxID=58109 RepID=A0A3N1CTZ0_9ACTN|nr:carboxyl transferase domain-containing protein [Actinocorallia herbida]ROO84773.1 biotin-dependent enzyme [Actinocorallia herbida]
MVEKVLVANRGEVAARVVRAARGLGIGVVGVRARDEEAGGHVRRFEEVVVLPGEGAAAYLDAGALVEAARRSGADAVHPGYGFLAESAEFARVCENNGLVFVGPSAGVLELFGDKARAREAAREAGVPVSPGTDGATDLDGLYGFWDGQAVEGGGVVVKALAGGGGRGMRVVREREGLSHAYRDASAEALAAFGSGEVCAELLIEGARHVEAQVAGDGTGRAAHLWDRECSVQRRHQKLLEVAPSGVLPESARAELLDAAVRLAEQARLRGLATVEFLALPDGRFFFLEVNPRLQVEHTVTEQVLGIDLVAAQFRLAAGASLEEAGLTGVGAPRGCAIQVRVNAETVRPDGLVAPAAGTLTRFEPAGGAGIRVETTGHVGMKVDPRFDSLLAKLVVHDPSGFAGALRLAREAVAETAIEGTATNLALQAAILAHPDVAEGRADTGWLDRVLPGLAAEAADAPRAHEPADDRALAAPVAGLVVAVEAEPGRTVRAGDVLVIVEAMKMQYPVAAPFGGTVAVPRVKVGDVVAEGEPLLLLDPDGSGGPEARQAAEIDLDAVRPDLAAFRARRALLHDDARPDAVAKRHRLGLRTARENIADLTDGEGLTVEYGGLAVAAQRAKRSEEDLQARTPADGIITGLGRVNGEEFPPDRSTCAVLAYDYTVLAGTQGYYGHQKTDRLLKLARERRHPVVFFAEGGGGRPGDTDAPMVAGLHFPTFAAMGALSGVVPTVGIAAGRCFAGNAALLGTCDVVIATRDATIGMGGPAMIEGGGLGVFTPEEVGPIEVQTRNGVVDVAVADEAEAVAVAKRYLSYFQGPVDAYETADQRLLRHLVPEDRKRVYDVRSVITTLCDSASVLELRAAFGRCAITALARIEGRPVGLIANDPAVLGGAIDADGADKLARFLDLCDAFALPVVSLCDTPGFMVGPDAEKTATVRHFPRLFVRGGHLTIPVAMVVLRKAYGLGALAMSAGHFHNTSATLSWPTGEFGGMNLEGAVRLAARDALAAIADPDERQRAFEEMVAYSYAQGSALNTASYLEIDEVIDPADTRSALGALLFGAPVQVRDGWANPSRRTGVDTW